MFRFVFSICLALAVVSAPSSLYAQTPAEELGLEPFVAPDDLYPIFTWDRLSAWGDKYMRLPETVRTMAECGCTLSGIVDCPEQIALARENGLRCIYALDIDMFSDSELSEEEIQKECAKIDAAVKDGVESTKNDPCVLGYFIVDEPGAFNNRSIAAAVAAVKKYAPGKLAYVNLYPCYAGKFGDEVDVAFGARSYGEYLDRYVREVKPQLLSYDNYMLECSEDSRNKDRVVGYFTDIFDVRKVALKYDLPFWVIGSSLSQLPESSAPNLSRYALQGYIPLAAGASGITWFLYFPFEWSGSPVNKSGHRTLAWVYMRDVNEQIEILGKYLKQFRSTDLGMTPLFTKEEAPNWPKLPALPTKVLKNLRAHMPKAASQALVAAEDEAEIRELEKKAYGTGPKLMVGEFERKDGNALAAVAVNLNPGASVKVFFDKPDGYSTLKVVSQVDGYEETISEEAQEQGFWILPGHGTLFVLEK